MTSHAESAEPAWTLTWAEMAEAPPALLVKTARLLLESELAPVNTALASPEGFDPLRGVTNSPASLRSSQHGSQIVQGNHVLVDLGRVPILDHAGLRALRRCSHVQIATDRSLGPVHLASTVAQLLVAGVPVVVDRLPLVAQRLLGDRLTDVLSELDGARLNDSRYRELWSLRARRLALLQLTTAGRVGTPIPVTVVADFVSDPAGLRLLGQLAAQDWPAVQILLARTGAPAAVPRVLLDSGHPVEVVMGSTLSEARRRAVARSDGLLATFMSAGLLYGPHHVTDLVLGHGYARTALVGISVRRSYLPPLDLCVEADGHAGERPGSTLTAGTLIATPGELAEREPHIAASGDAGPPRGFAIHDLGVARWLVADPGEIDRALTGSVNQSFGWAGAILDRAPSDPSGPSWPRQEPDAGYASYFTRSRRPAA